MNLYILWLIEICAVVLVSYFRVIPRMVPFVSHSVFSVTSVSLLLLQVDILLNNLVFSIIGNLYCKA